MNTKIKKSTIGRVTSLTYYDVTNYYELDEMDLRKIIVVTDNGMNTQ